MLEKLPKSISPCPIKDATIAIRFETSLPRDVVLGIAHQNFSLDYPKRIDLPMADLPTSIIKSNPELAYQAHYQLKNNTSIVQIGPQMISFGVSEKYTNWNDFYSECETCLKKFLKLGIVTKITKLGIRYIDFFEKDFLGITNFNIFDHITLLVQIPPIQRNTKETFVKTILEHGDFASILKILDNAKITNSGEVGSLIDLDTSYKHPEIDQKVLFDLIQKVHAEQKIIFFNLLKPEFLAKLNPKD